MRAIHGDVPFRDIVTGATKTSHQGCADQPARPEHEHAHRGARAESLYSTRAGSRDASDIRGARWSDRSNSSPRRALKRADDSGRTRARRDVAPQRERERAVVVDDGQGARGAE